MRSEVLRELVSELLGGEKNDVKMRAFAPNFAIDSFEQMRFSASDRTVDKQRSRRASQVFAYLSGRRQRQLVARSGDEFFERCKPPSGREVGGRVVIRF